MDSHFREATRSDERGRWRIDIDGRLELVARDCRWCREMGFERNQIYDLPTRLANDFRDWEPTGR